MGNCKHDYGYIRFFRSTPVIRRNTGIEFWEPKRRFVQYITLLDITGTLQVCIYITWYYYGIVGSAMTMVDHFDDQRSPGVILLGLSGEKCGVAPFRGLI